MEGFSIHGIMVRWCRPQTLKDMPLGTRRNDWWSSIGIGVRHRLVRQVEGDNEKRPATFRVVRATEIALYHACCKLPESQAATVSSNGPKNLTDEFELFDRRRLRPYSVVQVLVFFERLSRSTLLLSLVGSERLELR
jgi:hypothetical protein